MPDPDQTSEIAEQAVELLRKAITITVRTGEDTSGLVDEHGVALPRTKKAETSIARVSGPSAPRNPAIVWRPTSLAHVPLRDEPRPLSNVSRDPEWMPPLRVGAGRVSEVTAPQGDDYRTHTERLNWGDNPADIPGTGIPH